MSGSNFHRLSVESTREQREDDKDKGDPTSSNMPSVTSSDHDLIVDHDSEAFVVHNKSQEDLNPGESGIGEEEDGEYLGSSSLSAEEVEDECVKLKLLQVDGATRPSVWVRIRPTLSVNSKLLEVEDNDKKLRISVDPEKKGTLSASTFATDGILQTSNQEEIFQKTAKEVVEAAMSGVTGTVICVGPEQSGKNYTLFGPLKYEHRGLVPRSLELIFDIIEQKRDEIEHHVILSMFEIHMEKIKDLFTFGPYDLGRICDFGPKGLFYEEIMSLEHGLSLILRGLIGQRLIHTEPYAKLHTIVYIDILARQKQPLEDAKCSVKEWRSRITFAKIAPMPPREKINPSPTSPNAVKFPQLSLFLPPHPFILTSCAPPPHFVEQSEKPIQQLDETEQSSRSRSSTRSDTQKCCRGPTGEQAEAICVRKEFYFLEQMFIRSNELRQIHDYYTKLQSLGTKMLTCPPKTPSQYFRQCKLTHCLKDIVSENTMVRLILHIRPERSFLQSTLETMRFATRARCIPIDLGSKKRDNCHAIMEKTNNNMCQEMGIPNSYEKKMCEKAGVDLIELQADRQRTINSDKMKNVFKTAAIFFEDKLETLESSCKDQVKAMFDGFQEMWGQMLDKEFSAEIEQEKGEIADNNDTQNNDGHLDHDVSEVESQKSVILQSESKKNIKQSIMTKKSKSDRDEPTKAPDKAEEKKNKKRTGRASISSKRGKGRTDAKDVDDSGDMNKKRDRTANKKSVSQLQSADEDDQEEDEMDDTTAPIQDLSISVIPVGAADSIDTSSLIANLHFKCKCWEAFAKTETGNPLVAELGEKQILLKQYMTEHNETLKEVVNGLSKLVAIELNLDQLEPNRRFSDEADELNLLMTKEQRKETAEQAKRELAKLQNNQANIRSLVSLLDANKHECEKAFDTFCTDTHSKVEFSNRPVIDGDLDRRYDDICRIAKQEAQVLIRKAYPKRPPWTMFY